MYVGTKRLISGEAAADWRREREQAAAAEAENPGRYQRRRQRRGP
jgi:hypothetical protein